MERWGILPLQTENNGRKLARGESRGISNLLTVFNLCAAWQSQHILFSVLWQLGGCVPCQLTCIICVNSLSAGNTTYEVRVSDKLTLARARVSEYIYVVNDWCECWWEQSSLSVESCVSFRCSLFWWLGCGISFSHDPPSRLFNIISESTSSTDRVEYDLE